MPYRQEGERLVFDASPPVATDEPGEETEPGEVASPVNPDLDDGEEDGDDGDEDKEEDEQATA